MRAACWNPDCDLAVEPFALPPGWKPRYCSTHCKGHAMRLRKLARLAPDDAAAYLAEWQSRSRRATCPRLDKPRFDNHASAERHRIDTEDRNGMARGTLHVYECVCKFFHVGHPPKRRGVSSVRVAGTSG